MVIGWSIRLGSVCASKKLLVASRSGSRSTPNVVTIWIVQPEPPDIPDAKPRRPVENTHWTRNRRELLEWLRKSSPSLAELYEGAVDLLFGQPVAGFTRFVSHAVREVRNRLPGVISGTVSSRRLDYKSRIDDLALVWKRRGVAVEVKPSEPGNAASAAQTEGVVLPRRVAQKIESLIADHEAARERPRDTAIKLFEGIAPRNQRFRDSLVPAVLQWKQVCDWFMERTHESGFTDADIDLGEFRKNFQLFESTLLAIVRGVSTFFDNTDELDAILKEEPTSERVEAAIARMGHGEFHRYFFERLENPAWIAPLSEKKFFASPPPPARDEVRGTIGFSIWPESRYLFRMAKLDPDKVAEVVLRIPETENVRVHDDLLDIALALPATLAARLVPQAKRWVRAPYGPVLPQKLGALVTKLVEEGEAAAALDLAGALLEVLPDPRPVLVPEPAGQIDAWHYERILRKDVAALVAFLGMPAFELLLSLLADAVRLSQKENDEADFEDYSYVWRPSIEHGRGFSHGITDPLASAAVDAAVQLVTKNQASVSDVVIALDKRKWRLFHRIALHVLRLFGDRAPEIVAERLREPGRYDHSGAAREFWSLVESRFEELSPNDKEPILDWIRAGPDLDTYRNRWQDFTGQPVTEEDALKYGKRWRRDRLAVLHDGLPQDSKAQYDALVAELGPPEDITQAHGITGGGFGQIGPKPVTDLRTMEIENIVAHLKSWQPSPSPSPFGEKIADLAGDLAIAVGSDPARFGAAAQQFKDLDPTYVKELLQALREPAKRSDAFDWKEVLALCHWAVGQPRVIPGKTGGLFDRDPGWAWTRAAIVRLLSAGFEGDSLPITLRQEAWKILQELTEDPDPTPEDEASYLEKSNSDPSSLSINTIRGEAMHCVVQYALWVRRTFEKAPDREALIARGFDEMPEVRRVLERRLEPAIDSSLTTRSVYGRWLPWLHFLDRQWLEKHLEMIFPVDERLRTLYDCVWTTYVVQCEPYNDLFKALQAQYVAATQRIGRHTVGKSHLGDPDVRLGNHLLTLYWRGVVPLPTEAGPLQQFYAHAPDQLRGSATGFIGRALKNDEGEVPAATMERLEALWLVRMDVARRAGNAETSQEELKEFGWWFVSKKSNDEWSVDQLLEVLKISKKVEPDLWVVERLAELSAAMPRKTVECLTHIVDGDEEGWGILGWRDDCRKIIATALQSPDQTAKQFARELAHKLGGLGHFEFRTLLMDD